MKKLILAILMIAFIPAMSFAKGEDCKGDWDCSWDERCHKPSWRDGTCVEKE